MNVADQLIYYGYVPYLPHLSHFLHLVHPQEYETWLMIDLAWLDRCDALIRLSGLSEGADREVEYAVANEIPIFGCIEDLITKREIILP